MRAAASGLASSSPDLNIHAPNGPTRPRAAGRCRQVGVAGTLCSRTSVVVGGMSGFTATAASGWACPVRAGGEAGDYRRTVAR